MTGTVILLNGPSSSGKSTLARALMEAAPDRNFRFVSIDDYLEMSPSEPIYEDDVYEISPQLCAQVQAFLQKGHDVIVDHVITSKRIWQQLSEAAADYRLQTVLVTCPIEELRKREIARGNRSVGTAESSLEYLYPKEGYALTLDTAALTIEQCVDLLLLL